MTGPGLTARISASISHFVDTTFRPCPVCENLDFEPLRHIYVQVPIELRPNCQGCSILLQALQIQAPAALLPWRGLKGDLNTIISIWRADGRGPLKVRDTRNEFPEFRILSDPYVSSPTITYMGS
jgi:hypothetical protein